MNNTLLVLCIIGSAVVGSFIGYFAFVNIFQEQFQQQDRITLENFDSATVTLEGNVTDVQDDVVTIAKAGLNFPLRVTKDTVIFIPDTAEGFNEAVIKTGRVPFKEGLITDFSIGQTINAVVLWVDASFRAVSITAFFIQ